MSISNTVDIWSDEPNRLVKVAKIDLWLCCAGLNFFLVLFEQPNCENKKKCGWKNLFCKFIDTAVNFINVPDTLHWRSLP